MTQINQRFRETEGFEFAREAEGFSSSPRPYGSRSTLWCVVCVWCVCVCGVCVCVSVPFMSHTKNADVTRVHVTPKNQRFRETEGFEFAREAEGFSSTPRPMGHAQLYPHMVLKPWVLQNFLVCVWCVCWCVVCVCVVCV